MHFTSEKHLDGDVLERGFSLGEIPGIPWTPASAPAPLMLLSVIQAWRGILTRWRCCWSGTRCPRRSPRVSHRCLLTADNRVAAAALDRVSPHDAV